MGVLNVQRCKRQLEILQSCALCREPITSIIIRDNANYIDIIRS